MRHFCLNFLFFVLVCTSGIAQTSSISSDWAQNTLDSLSLEEKIGQLFMIRAHSDLGKDHIEEVKRQIKTFHVGGLCFFQGTPTKQADLTNEYQSLSKIPLMNAVDAEWGLGMRFKEEAISFPKQLTLGAIRNNQLIYQMGLQIAQQLREIGSHINFAPVVDVNNNAANPVIHSRSFGENIDNVISKSQAYMKGLQKGNVLSCAKHFPGHGDTDIDSHYDLPTISHDYERLDSVEIAPFRAIIQHGVGSIMSAHLHVPNIDNRPNRPTSLSDKAIQDLLRKELKFEGVVFTDGLEMQGVAKHFAPGKMEVEALLAGNDVLLLPIDIDIAFEAIKKALESNILSENKLNQKVLRILKAKQKLGLTKTPSKINSSNLDQQKENAFALSLKSELYEAAATLVKNSQEVLPIQNTNQKIACLSIGSSEVTSFQKRLKSYSSVDFFNVEDQIDNATSSKILKQLSKYDLVLISTHDMNIYSRKDYGLQQSHINLIYKINSQNKSVLINFGTPYALKNFVSIPTIVQAYEEDEINQDIIAQMIFGAIGFRGKLPVSVHPSIKQGQGIETASLLRLQYGSPESVGMNSDTLKQIDGLVSKMITEKATPGCQILCVKDGKVVYQKSFGHHTYDKKKEVQNTDLYDLASITKVLASTISMMKLVEQDKVALNKSIDYYLPEIDTSNKGGLVIQDILAHHAGLPGWIPFYKYTLCDDAKLKETNKDYYRKVASDSFSIPVADDLWMRSDYVDSIYNTIYACDLRENTDYRYSDLGFYLFEKIIKRVSQKPLDQFCQEQFYGSMGLQRIGFNPLNKFKKSNIIPSEKDDYFRHDVVHGHVHDMGAAMLGGVGGHAGLFSNSEDLAVLMQMLLNGGLYGGKKYLKLHTIRSFTRRHARSTRRGLGFDMKELDPEKTMNMSELASDQTFGHLGFTGTSVFADPVHNLVYIFLSNRTYPSMKNNKLYKGDYRPKIQSLFYKSIL